MFKLSTDGNIRLVQFIRLICASFVLLLSMPAFAADLQVSSYDVTPTRVGNGGVAEFTIRLTNNGGVAVNDAQVRIDLPDRFELLAGSYPSYCSPSTQGSQKILLCSPPSLPVGDMQIKYRATAKSVGISATEVRISSVSANDTNPANDNLPINATVEMGADLSVAKDDQLPGHEIISGGEITYRINVTNSGPDPTAAIRVIDNLPPAADFQYSAASGTDWSCSRSGQQITCLYTGAPKTGALPPISVRGRVVSQLAGTLTNSVSTELTSLAVVDPNGDNNLASAVTRIIEGTDLRASKSFTASTIVEGQSTTVTLGIINDGPRAVNSATITDVFADHFTLGAMPAGCVATGQSVTCTSSAIASGAGRNFVIPVTANAVTSGAQTNSAVVAGPAGLQEPDTDNNRATASYSIVPPSADLALTKSKTPTLIKAGDVMTSTIGIRNLGPSILTYEPGRPLRITDELSADEIYEGVDSPNWSCAVTGNVVTCETTNSGTLTVNQTRQLILRTRAGPDVDSVVTNRACVAPNSLAFPADNDVRGGANCGDGVARATTMETDLAVDKHVSLDGVNWVKTGLVIPATAQDMYIRFTARNLGAQMARTVSVTDDLPNRLNGSGLVTGFAEVSKDSGSLSYSASAGRITWGFTNLAPGMSQVAVVRITRPFRSGTFTNVAAITSTDTIDTDSANNESTASYTVDALADVTITQKNITPQTVIAGALAKYTIDVANRGANPAANVVVTDIIDPTRFELVGNAKWSDTSNGASCTNNPATGEVRCVKTSINGVTAYQIEQEVRPRYPFGGSTVFPASHINTANVTTDTVESDSTNNSNNVNHAVVAPQLNLGITKREPEGAQFDPRRFGEELVYDLRITNDGPSRATDVQVIDTPIDLPAGYQMAMTKFEVNPADAATSAGYTRYTPPAPSCAQANPSSGDAVCRLHNSNSAQNYLDARQEVIFRLYFRTDGPAPHNALTFKNQGRVTNAELEYDLEGKDNIAVQTTTVLPSVDLEVVSKTNMATDPVSINEAVPFNIVIRNNGESPIVQVRVTDTLPAGFALANNGTTTAPRVVPSGGITVSSFSCTGTNIVLCVLDGNFPPDGSTATLTIYAKASYPFTGDLSAQHVNHVSIAPGRDSEGKELARDPVDSNNEKTAPIIITASSIAGTVYADDNLDGTAQAGELLANVSVTISGEDEFGNEIAPRSVLTDASGSYRFDRLPPGTYKIVETQPAGMQDYSEKAGTAGGTVNNAAYGSGEATNSISSIALPANTNATGYDFLELRSAEIRGKIYSDTNNNGVIDAGEKGIGTAEFPSPPYIRLTGTDYAGNAINVTTIVDANGDYAFTNVAPSDAAGYKVTQEVQPTGYADGIDRNGVGNPVAGSANRSAPEDIVIGQVAAGAVLTNRDFGEIPSSQISGMVYLDPNGNAIRDSGENSGLSGAVITLSGTNDLGQAINCSVTTGATGAYSFPVADATDPMCRVLRPGTYLLAQTPPPGVTPSGAFIGSAGGQSGGANGANVPAVGAGNTSISNVVITGGTSATRYDFGATGQGLSGYVYVDSNDNGVRDAGEQGIPGVTITLSGESANGQDVCTLMGCTVTTDASGQFMFTNVPGSSATGYTLTEQAQSSAPLSAYADGKDAAGTIGGVSRGNAGNDVISGIVLAMGDMGVNYAFGERAGSLSGGTYIDNNDDGIRQPDENPLPGVTITLSGRTTDGQDICTLRASLDPALSCTVTTDANGNYRFDTLPSGDYTLTESQPSAYADGRESVGTQGGTVNNAVFDSTPASNRIASIPLVAGEEGTGYDFGERATTLSGRVYHDKDRDGNDNGEPGIAGVTITLKQGGTVIATTTTDANGHYTFPNLPAGNYTVEEDQPKGYGSSTPDSGSVNVSPGQNQKVDFGDTSSTLAGSVFVDSDNDGVRQSGERGIEGVTVRLTGTDDSGKAVDISLKTDASGNYRFDDLLSGTYVVTETQPAAYSDGLDSVGSHGGTLGNDSISAITLPVGTDATDYAFGERGQGQGGVVYVDTNRNGRQDPGEPGIPNVIVELQKPDGTVIQTVTTGPDGSYNFTDIEAGDYVIVEKQPDGYGDAPENPTNHVPLKVGVDTPVVPVNFGERVSSLTGRVYNDTNGDGTQNSNEPGIPGVTLTLTGTDARGTPVTQTVVSGPDGSYVFTGLPGGNYVVTETQPDGYSTHTNRPGTSGGAVSGDVISAITLTGAEDAIGYLYGEQGEGARISGHVWFDADHDRARNGSEEVKADWTVELLLGNELIASTTTGADGSYQFDGVAPGSGYAIRFRNPDNGAVFGSARTNETGASISNGVVSPANPAGATVDGGMLTGITVTPGAHIEQQSLPLDPSGVVYDSVRRTPVGGATVTISGPAGFDPAVHLLGGTSNVSQKTGDDGMYQFLLMPGAPAGEYRLSVTPPNGSYNPVQPSSIVPPCAGPLPVGRTPDPMLVSLYNGAPPSSAIAACTTGGQTTAWYMGFTLTPGVSANVVNNNIPIDPILEGAIEVTKRTPMKNVSRGGLVPYTITARNTLAGSITGIAITDRVPAGFRYREGSATVDGVASEPVQAGRLLSWPGHSFAAGQEKTVQIILTVGAGVGEGEHVNHAYAVNEVVDTVVSNVADATVRIIPDPDFDCSDVIGKLFDDRNMNGVQDEGEPGLPGVRLATARGLLITTDAKGRYHVTCPMIPHEERGSNFILKVDERTLPTGYRMISVNPDTVRLTRGKMVTMNFGATLGRVVRLDVTAAMFDGDKVGDAFLGKVDALVVTLAQQPSVLRIAYGAQGEDQALIRNRIASLRTAIKDRWNGVKDRYRLIIEEETTLPAIQKGDAQ
ncbi:MAG: DUF11 domain-containing protein [Sphingobium sp.]|nr:DUF11 domain-containing protein [Sphingobium sp.]